MSCSRISNITKTFKASLSQETKYELQDNIENIDQIQLKNISGTNILIYSDDNRPEGLTEIKDSSIEDNNFMYVLSDKSDILRIEKEDNTVYDEIRKKLHYEKPYAYILRREKNDVLGDLPKKQLFHHIKCHCLKSK